MSDVSVSSEPHGVRIVLPTPLLEAARPMSGSLAAGMRSAHMTAEVMLHERNTVPQEEALAGFTACSSWAPIPLVYPFQTPSKCCVVCLLADWPQEDVQWANEGMAKAPSDSERTTVGRRVSLSQG